MTEFLPVSSTGHLILFEHWLGISQSIYGLAFDAALHLGTLVAILWFFRETWIKLLFSIIRIIEGKRNDNVNGKLLMLLIIGTIPAMILGLIFESIIETTFRSPQLVGMSLILFSGVLFAVEKMGLRKEKIESLGVLQSLWIGFAQSIALIPGVSRSGITIAAGMMNKLTREEAARFAFLLSAPIVAGAGGIKTIKTIHLFLNGNISNFDLLFFGIGFLTAMISGYLTIKYFLRFLMKNTLYSFIIYRIVLGILVLLVF